MDSYEEWTRGEIARLRAEAEKATAGADTLQHTLNKWLESHGKKNDQKNDENQSLNGHVPTSRRRKKGYGDKNATALEALKAAPNGLTTDELFKQFSEMYGPKYKRSSLRALLWHQKDLGNIERRGDNHVLVKKDAGG